MPIFLVIAFGIIAFFFIKFIFFKKKELLDENVEKISPYQKLYKILNIIVLALSIILFPLFFLFLGMMNEGSDPDSWGVIKSIVLHEWTGLLMLIFFDIYAFKLYSKREYLWSILACIFPMALEWFLSVSFRGGF